MKKMNCIFWVLILLVGLCACAKNSKYDDLLVALENQNYPEVKQALSLLSADFAAEQEQQEKNNALLLKYEEEVPFLKEQGEIPGFARDFFGSPLTDEAFSCIIKPTLFSYGRKFYV